MRLHSNVFVLCIALAVSCDDAPERPSLPGDERVLAEVADTHITAWDLENGIETTLSEAAASQLDATGRRHMLETLVSSRAIALAREAELSAEDKERLEREVARHREQLLVRQYLEAHSEPNPVTAEMVRQYYEAHPERFGGGAVRSYEMLFTTRTVTDAERTTLLTRLGTLAPETDLRALATELAAASLPVSHQTGEASSTVLHPRLRQVLEGLELRQSSPVTFVDGRAFVLRVVGESRNDPRPLAEVAAEIRQTLAPTQLRDSISAVRRRVLARTRVRYRE